MGRPNDDPDARQRSWRHNLWSTMTARRLSADAKRAVVACVLLLAMLMTATVVDPATLFRNGEPWHKAAAIGGALLFAAIGMIAVQNIAREASRRTRLQLSASHASAIRLALSLAGYIIVAIMTLGQLGLRVDQLLLGGAVTGVIIGIAAQQSLGNVFAGVMLVVARPFTIGDHLVVHSGGLGGPLEGRVVEMGLVYLTLENEDGLIRLPNTGVLNSAVAPNSRMSPSESSTNGQGQGGPSANSRPPTASKDGQYADAERSGNLR